MNQKNKKFVIQQHSTAQGIHWDFMLELGDILQTYRLDKAPQQLTQSSATAVKIFDHPLKFLTYEGPLSKGQGSVSIVETGTYEALHQAHDRLELDLNGKILKGKFTLSHVEGDDWQFGKSDI